jgi:DNA replication protein DnaC
MSSPCPYCNDTGFVLAADGKPGAARRARSCACQTKARQAKREGDSGIPKLYARCSFANFQAGPGQQAALAAAQEIAAAYPLHEKGLLLHGAAGCGKTHLAVAIASALIGRGRTVRFVEYGALLDALRSAYDGSAKEGDVIAPYVDAPILILDDLGARRMTEWTLDIITRIVDRRYAHHPDGLLVITTNKPLEAVATPALERAVEATDRLSVLEQNINAAARHSAGVRVRQSAPQLAPESLAEHLNERLVSRLVALCRVIPVQGPDRRREG